MFFGYYASAAVMTSDENGPGEPELTRLMTLCSPKLDPVRALAPVLTAMPGQGIPPGDIIADSGYAHRDAAAWAIPLRRAGAALVQDLHPHDRGPKGTHHGAIIANGNLYCPATPQPLLQLAPPPPRRQRGRHRRPRPANRRASPAQAREDQLRRRRRLPPRHLPRRRRQDPLPAPAAVDDPGP
jgi:hypothetical protein